MRQSRTHKPQKPLGTVYLRPNAVAPPLMFLDLYKNDGMKDKSDNANCTIKVNLAQ